MKKPARRVTPNTNITKVVIKNPFLVAKLEKAARDMGCTLNEIVVFFVRKGFDKPTCAKKQRAEHPPESNGCQVG